METDGSMVHLLTHTKKVFDFEHQSDIDHLRDGLLAAIGSRAAD